MYLGFAELAAIAECIVDVSPYSFVEVDGVLASDDVGDGASARLAGRLLRLYFLRHLRFARDIHQLADGRSVGKTSSS